LYCFLMISVVLLSHVTFNDNLENHIMQNLISSSLIC